MNNLVNVYVQILKPVTDVQSILLKMMVKRMNGRFFSATVLTEKGIRKFNATTNTKKFNKGISKRSTKDNLVIVYDNCAKGVRTLNLKNLVSMKCGSITYNKE